MHTRSIVDAVASVATLGALFDAAPKIAACLAIGWYVIRFGEWAYRKFKSYKE